MAHKQILTLTSLLSLVSVLIVPVPGAYADTVTKEVTVLDSSSDPYPNAEVALYKFVSNGVVFLESETTNAQGVASFTLDAEDEEEFNRFVAAPPIGDYSHAPRDSMDNNLLGSDSNQATVELKSADIVVEMTTSAGETSASGDYMAYPGADFRIFREGPFGLDLSGSIASGRDYEIGIFPSESPTLFFNRFGLRPDADNPGEFLIYETTDYENLIQPTSVNGQSIYRLPFRVANFSGNLVDEDSNAISVTETANANVQLRGSNENGSVDPFNFVGSAGVQYDGSFYVRTDIEPDFEKIWPQFTFGGDNNLPTFLGDPIWVNSSGDLSTSASGPFVDGESFSYNQTLPEPNLKLRDNFPEGESAERIYYRLTKQELGNQQGVRLGQNSSSGLGNFHLEDGVYDLTVEPLQSLLSSLVMSVTVDLGQATITTEAGERLTVGSDGVFDLPEFTVPNFKLEASRSDGSDESLRGLDLEITSSETNFYEWTGSSSTEIGAEVPNGTYDVRVSFYSSNALSQEYDLVINDQGQTLTSKITGLEAPISNGFFQISPRVPHIFGTITAPDGRSYNSGDNYVWVSGSVEKKEGDSWSHEESLSVSNDGTFSTGVTEPGTYRIRANPYRDANLYRNYSAEFTVQDITTRIDLDDIALGQSNFIFEVSSEEVPEPIDYGSARIVKTGENVGSESLQISEGLAGFKFTEAGEYQLTISPGYEMSSAEAVETIFTINVTESEGELSIAVGDLDANDEGVYSFVLAKPNIRGQVKRPDGSAIDRNDGWVRVQLQKYDADDEDWRYSDVRINVNQDYSFGANVSEAGTYRLQLTPVNLDDSARTITESFEVTEQNLDSFNRNFSNLNLVPPTARFSIREPGSSVNVEYVGASVRKRNQQDEWDYVDWISTGRSGIANFLATEEGEFEIVAQPRYDSDFVESSVSFDVKEVSGSLEVSSDALRVLGDGTYLLEFGEPNITGYLANSSGERISVSNQGYVSIQLQKLDENGNWRWVDSTSAKSDGSFIFGLEETGTFRFELIPYGIGDYAKTFSETFNVSDLDGFSRSFDGLVLKGPNLKGVVYGPSGDTGISNSRIYAVNANTGRTLWEFGTWTDSEGEWQLALPEGSYEIYAGAPNQSALYGDSRRIKNIDVDSSGSVEINGQTKDDDLVIRLASPTWSGTVVDPTDNTVLAEGVQICLSQNDANQYQSKCTSSNSSGEWALTSWEGLTDFNDSSLLSIRPFRSPTLTELRAEGEDEIEAILGEFADGSPVGESSNLEISPALPNLEITVKAGSQTVSNAWVSVYDLNYTWLAGSQTDSNGVSRLNVDSLSTGMIIRARFGSDRQISQNYASTSTEFSAADVSSAVSDGVAELELSLNQTNFSAVIYKPGINESTPGEISPDSYVEVYDVTNQTWLNGRISNQQAEISLSLPAPISGVRIYRLRVNPSEPNTELLSTETYFVEVDSNADIRVSKSQTGFSTNALVSVGGVFQLLLDPPNLLGEVSTPEGYEANSLRGSYVIPIDVSTRRQLWELGANPGSDGKFGLSLPDGTYDIFAEAPWDLKDLTDSQTCEVSVSGDNLISECLIDDELQLTFREPNLTFTLLDSDDQVIRDANVNVYLNRWSTYASSDENGKVSLRIDSDDVQRANPDLQGTHNLRVSVYPNSDKAVQWRCETGDSKPICDELPSFTVGNGYLNNSLDLGTVSALEPNTAISVVSPVDGTTPVSNSRVAVYLEQQFWDRWLTSDYTNQSGVAKLNLEQSIIDDPNSRFVVEINPPWNQGSSFSQKKIRNLTYAQLTSGDFSLGTPNLKISAIRSDGVTASAWSSVIVEEVDSDTFEFSDWFGGFGTDRSGEISLTLDSEKTYKITANPGPSSSDSSVVCIVEVSSGGVVSEVADECASAVTDGDLELTLSSGNLQGKVFRPGGIVGLEGAIVFAEAVDSDGDVIAGLNREAVTDSSGAYSMNLDDSYNWELKVFYVNQADAITELASLLTPTTVTGVDLGDGTPETVNFTLNAK